MFGTFLRFELWFWLKSYMLWIFLGSLTFMMATIMVAEEAVLVDVFFGNTFRNSPFVIHRLYGISAVFGCLMVAAFVNSAAIRDFSCNTHQIIFSKPITRLGYLLGRFFGASIIALIPMLGASLSVFVAQAYSPGLPWGPTYWSAHIWSWLIFAVPNTFFIAAVVFSIAVWTRSSLASFLGILGLMVALSISGALIGSLANVTLAAMLDPFGDSAMALQTRYWTIADKNTQHVSFTGVLLWNRLLWTGIGFVFLSTACWKFSFTPQVGWIGQLTNLVKSSIQETLSSPFHTTEIPAIRREHGARSRVLQLVRMTSLELWTTIKSPVFICLIVGVVLSVMASLSVRSAEGFGLASLPVTFSMVAVIREALFEFQIVLITFYAGVFVWKEREAHLDEVLDALPFPTWLSFASKSIALFVVVSFVFAIGILSALFYQVTSLFFDLQPSVYFEELFVIGMTSMSCLIVLAVLVHVISPNKYVGYFAFILFLVANSLVWSMLGVETNMVQFGNLSTYTYSDLFGRQPYALAIGWFGVYWLLLTGLLGMAAVLLWPRGRDQTWGTRMSKAWPRWHGGIRVVSIAVALAWVGCGTWVYWNTQIRNPYLTSRETEQLQAAYETTYKSFGDQPHPRVTDIHYEIDLFPKKRGIVMKGRQTIVNADNSPIDRVLILTTEPFETSVEIEGATIVETDVTNSSLIFKFEPPMLPEETREMSFTVTYESKGFENSVQVEQIVQNGTFFSNQIAPQIGYQPGIELTGESTRNRHGLSGEGVTPLDPENLAARRNSYVSNNSDWVNLETIISTSGDQIAVAPGSIQRTWEKDGRRYFHYKLDHPSLNMYSFVSARYKVAVREWKGVQIEVYYHPDHEWNVDLMLRSIRKSLEYYTEAFGPYKHKQARIIEYPRVAFFAQAFPGTMPYSEGVGFIADIEALDDIDMVYYIVAHEMAHQWWAHQVIGANMQGATMLSETLAQYSALMVMEKEYGRDMMRKFLRYEMDDYLRVRGSEQGKEYPLMSVKSDQGYIHYRKGSIAMYHLKETIGEDKVNLALKSLVDKFAYSDGPYPTSVDLIDAIREQTPREHWGLLNDLFEKITLFENRTISAEYLETSDGKFQVAIDVEFKKLHAQGDGTEEDAPLDDWIEIGAFAKPDFGRTYGETLYRKRLHVTEPSATFTFEVDQEPYRVGVDPFVLLIDRNGSDNMRKPERTRDRAESN